MRVAAHGVDAERAAVGQVVRRAADAGASEVLVDLVTDPREPQVARQRAFGELLSLLDRRAPAPPAPRHARHRRDLAWPAHAA